MDTVVDNVEFRKEFAKLVRTDSIHETITMKEKLETLMSRYIDPVTLESIISNRQFSLYIQVMKNQYPDLILDHYIRSMKFNPNGNIDLPKTSDEFLSTFDLKKYRRRIIDHERRSALSESFSPTQIDTILKFSPKGVIEVIDLIKSIRLDSSSNENKMNALRLKLSSKLGSGLSNLNEPDVARLRSLSNGELKFFRDFTIKRKKMISEYVTRNAVARNRQNQLLQLTEDERNTLCEAFRTWWIDNDRDSIKLPNDKLNELKSVSLSLSVLTRNEWTLLKSIAPLTDLEIGKLSSKEINLMIKNPKLRQVDILRKFLTLDGSEREIITNFDFESGRGASTLSGNGKMLIAQIYGPPIQAFIAPIIWRSRDLNEFKLWFQGMNFKSSTWEDRLIHARILAIAMVGEKPDEIHEIGKFLREETQTTLFYYLRVYQYTGCTEFRDHVLTRQFPNLYGSVFRLSDAEDLRFFTWILHHFDPVKEINLRKIVVWTLLKSGDKSLIEAMRNRLRSNDYRLTKEVVFFQNDRFDWLTGIFGPEDAYEFFSLEYTQDLEDELSKVYRNPWKRENECIFTLSLVYGCRDPLPLLRQLKDERLREFFHRDPIFLLRRIVAMVRVDILEFFNHRLTDFRHLFAYHHSAVFAAFTESVNEARHRAFSENRQQYINMLKFLFHTDLDLYRVTGHFYISFADQLYQDRDDKVLRLFTALENPDNLLMNEIEKSNPDLHRRLDEKLRLGCGRERFKRGIGFGCMDSRTQEPNVEELHGVFERANKVGSIYTVFSIAKHIGNGDVRGLGSDTLNLWIMPKIGESISARMMLAGSKMNSPLMKNAAPVVGRVIGNLAAFLGLHESINEAKNATDLVDKKIADLHIITNSVYIIADVPAVVTGVMSGLGCEIGSIGVYSGPIGMAVSVGVLIVADFIESAFRVEKLAEKIHLTRGEKFQAYWRFFLGRGVDVNLQRDIQANDIYEPYVQSVLAATGTEYDRIVIGLPDILLTREEYFASWPFYFCKGDTKIVHAEFDFNVSTVYKDAGIGARVDVCVREMNTTVLPVPSTEKCLFVSMNGLMDIHRTSEKWFFPGKFISRERSGNPAITLFDIPTMDGWIELFTNPRMDLYFRGVNITIVDHNAPDDLTENRYHFTNELNNCRIWKTGRNYFYIVKNKFNCELIGNDNVIVVRDDFEDGRNMSMIVGSENTERLNISTAKYVDGRGGNDTIIGNNYTIVEGYWGDTILGKTITILPSRIDEIHRILSDDGFVVYNRNNQSMKIDEKSILRTLDGFTITPIKKKREIVTDLHLHKVLQERVIFDEELAALRNICNSNFRMVKQLSSWNEEIILGNTGNNIFYPNTDQEGMNFYWEGSTGTSHVYLLDQINAHITISQANGLLDFRLFKNAYDKTVVVDEDDLIIVNERLRLKVLNNYRNVTFAMDGNYYKLRNGVLERDYCSHPLRINGKMLVEESQLKDYYNCFEFESEEIMFFKFGRYLILQSGYDVLLIKNDINFDVSLRSRESLLTPVEFRDRAEKAYALKLYKIDKRHVEIYHNNDIGIVDFGEKSILDFHGEIRDDDLYFLYKYRDFIVVRNWRVYPETRRMMFSFKECNIDNLDCIVGNCEPDYVLEEIQIYKDKIEDDGSSLISNNRSDRYRYHEICSKNVHLIYLLLQHFLDKQYPLPKVSSNEKNICAEAWEIVENFQRALKSTAVKFGICVGEIDCFDFYNNVIDEIRNDGYSRVEEIIYSTAREIVPGNEEFHRALKDAFGIL